MKKNKLIIKVYKIFMLIHLLTIATSLNVYAAEDPLKAVQNLSDLMFSFAKVIGFLFAGLGIFQIGLAFKSHDPQQRAQGILSTVGGLLIAYSKEIIAVITS